MRFSGLALLSLLLPAAYGLHGNITLADRDLGVNEKVRRGRRGPRFRACEIIIRGSPLDLPSGIKVKKYLRKSNLTVVKVTCGHEEAIVKKLRQKGRMAEENFCKCKQRHVALCIEKRSLPLLTFNYNMFIRQMSMLQELPMTATSHRISGI